MSELICKVAGSNGKQIAVYDNKCVITTEVKSENRTLERILKTILYIDVVGVKFAKRGYSHGYLHLETVSVQLNNQNDNMVSENTFTFEYNSDDTINILMEKIHDYIVDKIGSYKYGTRPQVQCLQELVSIVEQRSKQENQLKNFLTQASACTHVMEVYKLWETFELSKSVEMVMIDKKIKDFIQIERMYGGGVTGVQNLLDDIRKMI